MQVAVTRAADQLAQLMSVAADRQITIVPLPVTRIESVSFQWPDNLPVDQIDWLVFSSVNGVTHFFRRIKQLQVGLSRHVKIAAVGDRTAAALQERGWNVQLVPDEARGDVMFDELVSRLSPGSIVVYPQAETIACNPRQKLFTAGARYIPVVCYRSTPQTLDRCIVDGLAERDVILFTAPSSVAAFDAQFGRPRPRILAIGTTTAAALQERGWEHRIMKEAHVDSVLEYV